MEKLKYLLSRFGMIIPFALTVIMLFVSKSVEEPHAHRAETAMWVFFGLFGAALVTWIVRVVIRAIQVNKEIDEAEKNK